MRKRPKKHFLERKIKGVTVQRKINYLITDWINEDCVNGEINETSSEMLRVRIIQLVKEVSK